MKKLTSIGITIVITAWGKEQIMVKRYKPSLSAFIFLGVGGWGWGEVFYGGNGIPCYRFVF
jgi:hypothetical protein